MTFSFIYFRYLRSKLLPSQMQAAYQVKLNRVYYDTDKVCIFITIVITSHLFCRSYVGAQVLAWLIPAWAFR